MNYSLPFSRFVLCLLGLLFIAQSCSPVNKKELALKQATLLSNALVENDCETIYQYNLPPQGEKSSKEAFMYDCEKSLKSAREAKANIKKIELSPILKMIHCNGKYQCLIKRKTIYNGTLAPRDMFVVGLSEDGENWKFAPTSYLNFDVDKKNFSWLCKELYN